MMKQVTSWIGRDERWGDCSELAPAPYLRRSFTVITAFTSARVRICGLGYYELYLNGCRVGDHVLDPIVTEYDKRVRFVTYDITEELTAGESVFGVILGNGWYNSAPQDIWGFYRAAWRDCPKLWFELELDGEVVLRSDTAWRTAAGPIVFDALRNGEYYDARRELGAWASPGFDDCGWEPARLVSPPGGILEEQTSPPIKIMARSPLQRLERTAPGRWCLDFGATVAGWVRLRVRGPAGAEVKLQHVESLAPEWEHLAHAVKTGDFQTDRYILKGDGIEEWAPRFTYHGFRYTLVACDTPEVEILGAEAEAIHTAFTTDGDWSAEHNGLNRLLTAARNSYTGNFVGIPTDCPSREKNGWTGDALFAAESGLSLFDSASSYAQWLDTWADMQRPSGQLPAIVPGAGWGYNWGSGPAWDSGFFQIPWYIYLYTGDDTPGRRHFDGMRRYFDFSRAMAPDGRIGFGLGDWCAPNCVTGHVDIRFTSMLWYYADALVAERFARRFGCDATEYGELAATIRQAFHADFYRGDGVFGDGSLTEQAGVIYHGIADAMETAKAAVVLSRLVEEKNAVADFGIQGAKFILRALSMIGRTDLALRVLTQPEYPGWMYWIEQGGATTLWETWEGNSSRNHIMFGDFAAWGLRHLGGIAPDAAEPGFRHVLLQPEMPSGLAHFSAWRRTPWGRIVSRWRRDGADYAVEVEIPEGSHATLRLPDATNHALSAGSYRFTGMAGA